MTNQPLTIKGVQRSVVIGGNVQGSVTNIHQSNEQTEMVFDLLQLANELAKLREVMSQNAKTDDESIAVGAIAQAKKAAESENTTEVMHYLKLAGNWALDIATKIGVPIAIEALKQAMQVK